MNALEQALEVFDGEKVKCYTPQDLADCWAVSLAAFKIVCPGCDKGFDPIIGEHTTMTYETHRWFVDQKTDAILLAPEIVETNPQLWHGACAPKQDRTVSHFRKDDPRVGQSQPGRN